LPSRLFAIVSSVALMRWSLNAANRISKILCEIPESQDVAKICLEATALAGTDVGVLLNLLPTIEQELLSLPQPRDPGKAVYVIHGPPAGIGLDVCRGGEAVGSPAMFRFLESRQPLLSLHGHIHESPEETGTWKSTIGRTIVIQPGQSSAGLTVVIGDLDAMTFERRVLAP